MWTRERKAGSHTQIWDGSEFSRSQFARMQFSARYSSSQGVTNYRGGRAEPEQGLLDEVLYLHSLWRQGPPPGRRFRPENAVPSEEENSSKRRKREPEPVTEKKKKKKKKSKGKNKQETKEKKQRQKPSEEETPEEPGKPQEPEKPQEPDNANNNWTAVSDWDTNKPVQSTDNWEHSPSRTLAEPLTQGEQLQLANINLQHKAVRAFKEFLTKGREDESSEEDDEDDEEVEEEDDEVLAIDAASVPSGGAVSKEANAQKFFQKLFEEDQELRQFYEQNCNCGAFECVVCAAVGAKLGKRFPDCVSLIQHAMKILKTKKKAAHRGYGRSICCLLGWNADRLPSGGKPIEVQPRGCIPPPDEVVEEQVSKKDNNGKENEPVGESVSEVATDNADDEKPASS